MTTPSPRAQLEAFIEKYSPEIARDARAALARMRKLLPGSIELVYDNYNALAIGFAPSERTSEAVFSIALYPRWVSLFFLQDGPGLPDPEKLLKGSGSKVRHIVLQPPSLLDTPAVRTVIGEALRRTPIPIDSGSRPRIVIKSISPKQRPRRPT